MDAFVPNNPTLFYTAEEVEAKVAMLNDNDIEWTYKAFPCPDKPGLFYIEVSDPEGVIGRL